MQKLMEFEARVTYSPGSNFMAGDRTVAIPEESIMYSSGSNCMCLHFRMLAKTVTEILEADAALALDNVNNLKQFVLQTTNVSEYDISWGNNNFR